MTVLTASGDWGKVTEAPNSGQRSAMENTANILLNTNLFAGVIFSPQNLSILGGDEGFGPYQVQVALAQVRPVLLLGDLCA